MASLADVWLGSCRVPKDDLGADKVDGNWRLKLEEIEIKRAVLAE